MVPRTFPSSLHPFTGRRQLVALFLGDVTGLQRWVDYIPVNFGSGTSLVEGSYENNGFIAIQEISSGIGLQAFLDYIPVFFDADSTDTWHVSAVGFIPYGVSGVTSPPSLELSFTRSQTLDPRITFTRSTTATFTGSDGLIQTAAINAPRFDYNPTTLAPLGLLIEEQRVNLLLYSEELDTGWTNGTGATWQYSSGVSPEGTTTALGVDGLSGTGLVSTGTTLYRVGTAISGSTAYTFSVYVRAKTGTANIALRMSETGGNNTVSSGVIVTTAWTRVSMSVTSAAGATSVTVAVGTASGAANVFIWGAQLEAGAFATSYIPTVASQVTRAGDLAVMTGTNFSSWYNATEGTFYAQFTPAASNFGANKNIFVASDGTTSNFVGLRYASTGAQPAMAATTLGVSQANIATGAMVAGTNYKLAGAYKANDFAASRNAGTVGTDASGTIPTVTQAEIGALASLAIGTQHIQRLVYYPRRLSNAELQGITA